MNLYFQKRSISEVLIVEFMRSYIFCDVMRCSPVKFDEDFGGTSTIFRVKK
jgi:hypothetical protein